VHGGSPSVVLAMGCLVAAAATGPAVAHGSDGFEPLREDGGCAIAGRPKEHDDKAALRARCHWPDVEPEALLALVSDYARYPEFVWPLKVSDVRRSDGARSLVYQRQSVWPLADREVLLWMWPEPWAEGGTRVRWTAATEEPLQVDRGSIKVPRSDGHWAVRPHPEGGSWVEHQISMDGGGKIPEWLMDKIRARGFAQVTLGARDRVLEGP